MYFLKDDELNYKCSFSRENYAGLLPICTDKNRCIKCDSHVNKYRFEICNKISNLFVILISHIQVYFEKNK